MNRRGLPAAQLSLVKKKTFPVERGRGCVTETLLAQGAGLNVAPCRRRDTSIRRFCSVLERTSHQPPPPSPVRPPVNVTARAETPGFLFSPPGCRPAAEPEAVVSEPAVRALAAEERLS